MTHALGGFALLNLGLRSGPDPCPGAARSAKACVPVLPAAHVPLCCAVDLQTSQSPCRSSCPESGDTLGGCSASTCLTLCPEEACAPRPPPPQRGENCPKRSRGRGFCSQVSVWFAGGRQAVDADDVVFISWTEGFISNGGKGVSGERWASPGRHVTVPENSM